MKAQHAQQVHGGQLHHQQMLTQQLRQQQQSQMNRPTPQMVPYLKHFNIDSNSILISFLCSFFFIS